MAAPPSLPTLISQLGQRSKSQREAAAKALFHLGPKAAAAVPALTIALGDAVVEIRRLSATALARIGLAAEPAVPKLREVLDHPRTRVAALDALSAIAKATGGIGPEGARIVAMLNETIGQLPDSNKPDKDGNYPSSYIEYLARFGEVAVAPLLNIMQTRQGDLGRYATFYLGEIGTAARAAAPALIKALKSNDRTLLCYSCRSLGNIRTKPKQAVPALMKLFKSDDVDVRRYAIWAARDYGPAAAPAVNALHALLDEPTWIRLDAAEALGSIGPAARSTLPSLTKLLTVPERKLREAAEVAIGRISGTAAETLPISAEDARTIDFVRTKAAILEMLEQGLSMFAVEHPTVEVSAIGLFGHGYGRSASLCLETPEHSARHIEGQAEEGLVKKDKVGQFNSSIYDFAYCEYASDNFEWWPSLYDVSQDFCILMPNGKTVRRSSDQDGNNAIDVPFFKLLREILREAPIPGVRRAKPFRLGVEMANSHLAEFWVAKQ